MKQRITYILPEGNRADLADIKADDRSLTFAKASQAAEEWRLTLGLDELPDELQAILKDCHELHIRWASPQNDQLLSPLVSRLPAGFHAFFTPRERADHVRVCDLLQRLLPGAEAKCHNVQDTFSKPRIASERFASSSTYQYYHPAHSIAGLSDVVFSKVCDLKAPLLDSCDTHMREFTLASYIDIDFDAISHALTFTSTWAQPDASSPELSAKKTSRPIRKAQNSDRVEVGVLQVEKATEPEELSLGGYLTVIGEDDHPGTTLFSFPSRHHALTAASPSTFRASFHQPAGLHPKLEITLPGQHLVPPKDTCGLHAYWTLPSAVFIDRYQLADRTFLSSQNLIALHSLSGEDDLEAPDWAVKRWGSVALLQLGTPRQPGNQSEDWTVTVPTHLRYVNSTGGSSDSAVSVPWPIVFWACEAEEGLKMSTNPFDRVNLGYDGLFGPKTMFYHIAPATNVRDTFNELKLPTLDKDQAVSIQLGTLLAVATGFAWICRQLLRRADLQLHNSRPKKD